MNEFYRKFLPRKTRKHHRDKNKENLIPNPDKPEKWPQRPEDTKKNCLLKSIFVFWCLGGENVLPQNTQK
jgi:hypothetical protein